MERFFYRYQNLSCCRNVSSFLSCPIVAVKVAVTDGFSDVHGFDLLEAARSATVQKSYILLRNIIY